MENFSFEQILIVLGLTTFAGLATGIGGAIGFFVKKTNTRMLTFLLGLSAGVMIFISFVELFASAQTDLAEMHGNVYGKLFALAAFFAGIGVAMLIDKLVPADENPHETHGVEELKQSVPAAISKRSGLLFALAIGIHNFPEGLATFAAGLSGLELGVPIAIAVALHNIPEGITVSVPIFHATGSRKKAFLYSFAAGLAEPVGAVIGMLILMPFLSPTVLAILFAAVAGVMVFISFDELLPMSERWGHHHLSIYGIGVGMLVMGITLCVL
ncbi:MAG: zinc transporter ZupT [Verrucomicrobia bacterium]|nr:zinc transporter ZupT [Verrucomicrobiota bacterium]